MQRQTFRSIKRRLAAILTVLLVFSLCSAEGFSPSFAGEETGNTPQTLKDFGFGSHWAAKSIAAFIEEGILNENVGQGFQPDKPISRAEFAQIAVQLFHFDQQKEINYKDVKKGDWYYGCLSRAAAQGFMQGYNGKAEPDAVLTRQDAVVMTAKMLKMEPVSDFSTFLDTEKISGYAKGYVGALAEAGYLKGDENGNVKPLHPMLRCEAISLLHTISGKLYHQPGIYDLNDQQINGSVTVASPGITLKNAVIQGDLYITEGVGLGEVTLENVVVKGRTLISGGGMNSILLINTRLGQVSIVVPDGAPVRLVASGNTSVGVVSAASACKLQEDNLNGSGFEEIMILVPANAKVSLDGEFDKVIMDSPKMRLDILEGNVKDLVVTEKGQDAEVKIASTAKVNELDCQAQAYVGGTGKIGHAAVSIAGVQIAQIPELRTKASSTQWKKADEKRNKVKHFARGFDL